MALPDKTRFTIGTKIVLSRNADYSPSQGQGTRTHEFNLVSITAGEYRGSAEVDLGANLDIVYSVKLWIEFFSNPAAGGTVDCWAGYSQTSGATDNPANLSHLDGDYVGYGAAAADADEAISQLEFVGSLVVSADTDVQCADIGFLVPKNRYLMIVIKNNTSVALAATNTVQTAVVLTPMIIQQQD